MKRLAFIAILLSAVLSAARAQSNVDSIDDLCYEYFKMAETLVDDLSNDAFDVANEALLKRAHEVGDQKARTLYWVCRLKRACRIARFMDNRQEANRLVDKRHQELMDVARETGYMQYFYYGYELAQNYYINTRQQVHGQTLLQQMMDYASKDGNEYGLWQSQRYLSLLFQRQNDLLNTRKYLRQVINIYLNTDNPTIRRQSLTRPCCDIADTYPKGSDSARFYYDLAEKTAILHNDTVRVAYYRAQLAALDKQPARYRKLRDYCLYDDGFLSQLYGGDLCFATIDGIIEQKPLEEITPVAEKVAVRQQMIFLRDLAIAYGRPEVAAWMGTNIILTLYSDISYLNDMKMEEIADVQRNNEMTAAMEKQEKRIRLLFVLLAVLTAAIVGLVAGILIQRKKKKNK